MDERNKEKRFLIITILLALAISGIIFRSKKNIGEIIANIPGEEAAKEIPITLPFHYSFSVDGELEETRSPSLSTSPYWWLNSGGEFILKNGRGMTIQNRLPTTNKWRIAYNLSNPADTDQGFRPQNIFRILTRSKFRDVSEEVSFSVTKYSDSRSPNRNESNGVLLFLKYMDADNLYYAGIRVDGTAVIKKKHHGVYSTIASKKVLDGEYSNENNNLIPNEKWMSIRFQSKDFPSGSVFLSFAIKKDLRSEWETVLEIVDDGKLDNSPPLTGAGNAGIRSDFLDVVFDDFRLEEM